MVHNTECAVVIVHPAQTGKIIELKNRLVAQEERNALNGLRGDADPRLQNIGLYFDDRLAEFCF